MVKNWIRRLRYILIILTAVIGLLWLSSSFGYSAWVWTRLQVWDVEISVLPYWNFITSVWGYSRSVLTLPNNSYVFWTPERIGPYPYVHYNVVRPASALFEWFFRGFYICDDFTWTITEMPWNCSWYEFTWSNLELLRGYLTRITYDDFWYIDNIDWDRLSPPKFVVCVSTAVARSLCLYTESNWNLWQATLHLDNQSWSQIPQGYIWNSPWSPSNWGWGGWSILEGISDITNGMVIKSYEKMGFTRDLCFGWIFSWNQLITPPWTWNDLFSIYETNNPLGFSWVYDWYNYYRYWIEDYRNIWTWSVFRYDWAFHMTHYNLFANYLRGNVSIFPTYDILDYCELVINNEKYPDSYYSVYSWDLTEIEKQFIYNSYTIMNYYNSSGFDFSWAVSTLTWFTEGEWDVAWFDFFKNLNKQWANWLSQLNWNLIGIIPNYILVFMFALIFIRILRK